MITNDLLAPAFISKGNEKAKVITTYVVTVLLGSQIALFTCFTKVDGEMWFLMAPMEYATISLSVLSVPFVMGVAGLRGSRRGFVLNYLSFWFFFFLTKSLLEGGYLVNVLGLFSPMPLDKRYLHVYMPRLAWLFAITGSTLVFFLEHYIRNGGFAFIERGSEE